MEYSPGGMQEVVKAPVKGGNDFGYVTLLTRCDTN